MPPRYAYWVIILDGTATSFRARSREELLPTFNRLRAKDPGAALRWFERGKLFDSPTLAREDRLKEAGLWEDRDRGSGTGDQFRAKNRDRGPGTGDRFRTKNRDRGPGARDQFRTKDRDARPGKAFGLRPKGQDRPSSDRAGNRPTAKRFDRGPKPPSRPGPGRPPGRRPDERRDSAPAEKRPAKPERRGKDWRPGGEHVDPRDKYKGQPGQRRKRWKERFFAKGRSSDGPKGPKKR